jgi:hypothetical protein
MGNNNLAEAFIYEQTIRKAYVVAPMEQKKTHHYMLWVSIAGSVPTEADTGAGNEEERADPAERGSGGRQDQHWHRQGATNVRSATATGDGYRQELPTAADFVKIADRSASEQFGEASKMRIAMGIFTVSLTEFMLSDHIGDHNQTTNHERFVGSEASATYYHHIDDHNGDDQSEVYDKWLWKE